MFTLQHSSFWISSLLILPVLLHFETTLFILSHIYRSWLCLPSPFVFPAWSPNLRLLSQKINPIFMIHSGWYFLPFFVLLCDYQVSQSILGINVLQLTARIIMIAIIYCQIPLCQACGVYFAHFSTPAPLIFSTFNLHNNLCVLLIN